MGYGLNYYLLLTTEASVWHREVSMVIYWISKKLKKSSHQSFKVLHNIFIIQANREKAVHCLQVNSLWLLPPYLPDLPSLWSEVQLETQQDTKRLSKNQATGTKTNSYCIHQLGTSPQLFIPTYISSSPFDIAHQVQDQSYKC